MGFDEPESIEITSLGDPYRHHIVSRPPYTITSTGSVGDTLTFYPPSTTGWQTGPYTTSITADDWPKVFSWEEMMKKLGKEEEAKVNVVSEKSNDEHIVYCKDPYDLSVERILTTLSAVKGKLMYDITPIHIKEIQCKMTSAVRKRIIDASKRLKMYGKNIPIIPSFDEYGNRLPDTIEIGDDKGIIVKIVDPDDYGEDYFELKAIEFSNKDYCVTGQWEWEKDLPF